MYSNANNLFTVACLSIVLNKFTNEQYKIYQSQKRNCAIIISNSLVV